MKLTTDVSWSEIRIIPGTFFKSLLISSAAVSIYFAFCRNPSLPNFISAAHVPEITEPDLDPAKVGVTYMPPGHEEIVKNETLLSSTVLKSTTEHPLGP